MTGTTDSPDRRASRRAPLDAPAMVEAPSSHGTVRCRNVSLGGMAVDAPCDLPVGTPVEVYFELPTGVAVEARAEVVRQDGPVIALRFLDLTREEQLALRAHSRISGLHRLDQLHHA